MANGADTNKEFLSVPDASAHEEKKQLEQPAEKQKCMGVSKAGRQCIQFALPGVTDGLIADCVDTRAGEKIMSTM